MSHKERGRKQKLAKKGSQRRWAPFWTIPKIFPGRRMHPSRVTAVKRNWRKGKIDD